MKNNDYIQLTVLGGGREIGANSYLLQWGDETILLDAGQDPNKELFDALVPIHRIPNNLDAMIITHGHFDHIGSIPFIWKKRHPKKIITQKFSRPIIERMSMNSAVYMKRFDKASQQYAYSKAYYEGSLDKVYQAMRNTCYPYMHSFKVTEKISGYFFDAGHILGSSGVVLTDGDYTFSYTGDIALQDHGVHSGAKLPHVDNLDFLLIESTTSSETKTIKEEEQWQSFFDDINDAKIRNSRILIPGFALGRSQDIIALIDYAKRRNLIDQDIPVYLTGLGNAITEIYEKHKSELRQDLMKGSFKRMAKSLMYPNLLNCYYDFKRRNETAIFICTNGMMAKGTPAAVLASKMVTDSNETIIISGYQAPTTLGFEVLNATVGDTLDFGENREEFIPIKTDHISQIRLSGHGSKNDMVDIVKHLSPKNIAVIHGETSSVSNLMKALQDNQKTIIGPETGETLLLRSPDSKIMRSKSDIKAQIITVGTSLLGSYMRNNSGQRPNLDDLVKMIVTQKEKTRACSAEIQTMNGLDLNQSDYLYFISTGEKDGILCGDALEKAYRELGFQTQNIIIDGLTKDYHEFQSKGLPQFIHRLVDIIEDHGNNAQIIATGGFKAETAFASMIGSLMKISVFYIHEDFQSVIELPGLPVGLDFSSWTSYFHIIDLVLAQNKIAKAKKIIERQLPEFMDILFTEDKDLKQMILTPIGELVKRLHAEYLLSQDNIMKLDCKASKMHLIGTGPILIKDIQNHELRLILTRFQLQSAFIRKITIGKDVGEVSEKIMIKFHHKENEKIYYQILTQNGGQELIIHTYSGVEKELINRVGKTIQV